MTFTGIKILSEAKTKSAAPALELLQDYGCLHYKVSIICGISEPRYDAAELKRLNEQNTRKYDIDGKEMSE